MTQALAAAVSGLLALLGSWLFTRSEVRHQRQQFEHELELQEKRLRAELKTEYMAEAAIHQMLTAREPKRTFQKISDRVGGFEGDDLRRLLVRSGALRWTRKSDGAELWGLRERNDGFDDNVVEEEETR